MNQGSLLLVDDDRQVLESMADWLRDQGYELDATDSYQEAVRQIESGSYDLVLSDIRLSDGDGADLVDAVPAEIPSNGRHLDHRIRHG